MTEEELRQAHAAYQKHVSELQAKLQTASRFAQMTQDEINNRPLLNYACIVAVDEAGSFAKDGKIPWHYPEDFKWFQTQTKGHICVMGRTTYEDITNHLGDKAADSVLPGRKCFVVTSKPLAKNNAIAVANISEVEKHLTEEDKKKTIFFCGGERIYSEGIAYCDTVIITIVNKNVEGDRKFPTKYTLKHFDLVSNRAHPSAPDLRFTTWKRRK